MMRMRCAIVAAGGAMALLGLGRAAEGGVPAYTLVGSFELPSPGAAFDVLGDGRVMAISGQEFLMQDSLHSSAWELAGSLPAGSVSSFGATFLRISPDGQTIAVGDNNFGPAAHVHFVSSGALTPGMATAPTSVASSNYEAHWRNDSTLLVTGFGDEAVVNQISLEGAPSVRTLVRDVAGAAGGVVTDGMYLYTSNGFAYGGGSLTGDIRAFPLATLDGTDSPLSFESDGMPVAFALSGASLDFDALGHLIVGGGDTTGGPGGLGFAAVIDHADLASALLGGPIATPSLELTPDSAENSYSTRYNAATGEILVSFYDNTTLMGGTTVYRYAVPAPGVLGVAVIGAVAAARRRRHG